MTTILCGNFEKSFLKAKNGFMKGLTYVQINSKLNWKLYDYLY